MEKSKCTKEKLLVKVSVRVSCIPNELHASKKLPTKEPALGKAWLVKHPFSKRNHLPNEQEKGL